MKKLALLFGFMFLILVLTACSGSDPKDEEELKWIDVKLTIEPENPKPNEPVFLKAKVTYGDKVITDANEVKFEIWRAHDEEHQEKVIKEATDGVYQLEKSFDREGTYYMIGHVTAEGMHNMPKLEFVVGSPSEPETGKTKSNVMKPEDMENQ
jgi:hypothetical protein